MNLLFANYGGKHRLSMAMYASLSANQIAWPYWVHLTYIESFYVGHN